MSRQSKQRPAMSEAESAAYQKAQEQGFHRILHILDRDGGRLFLSGLLTLAAYLPALLLCGCFLVSGRMLGLILTMTLTGPLCFAAQCAMFDTVLRALRTESNFWWPTYRRAWRQNYRACILPGLLFGMAYGFLSSALVSLLLAQRRLDLFALVMLLLCLILLTSIATLMLAQVALIESPFDVMLKNSLLLLVPFFPRLLLSSVLQIVFWGAQLLLFPVSAPLTILLGFWLGALLALYPIYRKPLNSVFKIESRVSALRTERGKTEE